MRRKLKTMAQLLIDFPELRFSKEGVLILDSGTVDSGEWLYVESEDLKYIGNETEGRDWDERLLEPLSKVSKFDAAYWQEASNRVARIIADPKYNVVKPTDSDIFQHMITKVFNELDNIRETLKVHRLMISALDDKIEALKFKIEVSK